MKIKKTRKKNKKKQTSLFFRSKKHNYIPCCRV